MFFATRTKHGERYWRYVELDGDLTDSDLEMLRRLDPGGSSAGQFEGIDLETAWQQAAEDIVAEHNRRADPRAAQDAIGPRRASRSSCFVTPRSSFPKGLNELPKPCQ